MNDDKIERLDPALASLFRDERTRGQTPASSRARVLQRLEASLGPLGGDDGDGGGEPDGGGSGPSSEGGGGDSPAADVGAAAVRTATSWLPIAGALAVGSVIGGLAVSIARPSRVVYVDRVAPVAAMVASSSEPSEVSIAAATRPEASAVPSAGASSSAPRDGALAAERAILDVARTALGRGDGQHALEAVERHAREFRHGQMAEEREAIGVQALVKLGRRNEAAARGARFRQRYPHSVLIPVIDAAIPEQANGQDEGRSP